jgi:hypothetical protein
VVVVVVVVDVVVDDVRGAVVVTRLGSEFVDFDFATTGFFDVLFLAAHVLTAAFFTVLAVVFFTVCVFARTRCVFAPRATHFLWVPDGSTSAAATPARRSAPITAASDTKIAKRFTTTPFRRQLGRRECRSDLGRFDPREQKDHPKG